MKLAEALMLRSDMQKKLASLRERIVNNARVQEGEAPHEDPNKLMGEANGVLSDLEKLIAQINAANQTNALPDGRTITQAIAHRDTLTQRHSLILAAIAGTRQEADRYSLTEIKWVATVDVNSLQRQADDLSKNIRELNGAIQQTNWAVEFDAE